MAPIRLDRAVIAVTGPGARAFLQNLITQDIDRLERAPCLYGALLTPQGKIDVDFLLWRAPDGALIEAPRARGADLATRLTLFRLRAQVDIADVSADWAALASLDEPLPSGAPDPRLAALGWRALVRSVDAAGAGPDSEALRRRRIALGVPELAEDAVPGEVFALEALLEELNGVAFHKGCFVGHENVSRMKRRATTRKKFAPIVFDGPAPSAGAPVLAGGATLGEVRSGMEGRALALLRLDRAMAAANLEAGGKPARLDRPPWLILPETE
jgi:folate-binding protein YgfZ